VKHWYRVKMNVEYNSSLTNNTIFWSNGSWKSGSQRGCICVTATITHLAARQADADDVALCGFDLTEKIAFLLVRHPACLLRVVGFRLIDPLLLEGDEEVWSRIGILSLLSLRGWHLRFFFWALPAINWCRGTHELPPEVLLLLREGRTVPLLPVVCFRDLLLVRRRTDYFWRHVLGGPGERSVRTSRRRTRLTRDPLHETTARLYQMQENVWHLFY